MSTPATAQTSGTTEEAACGFDARVGSKGTLALEHTGLTLESPGRCHMEEGGVLYVLLQCQILTNQLAAEAKRARRFGCPLTVAHAFWIRSAVSTPPYIFIQVECGSRPGSGCSTSVFPGALTCWEARYWRPRQSIRTYPGSMSGPH